MKELSKETKANLKLMQAEVLIIQREIEMFRLKKALINKEIKERKEQLKQRKRSFQNKLKATSSYHKKKLCYEL